MKKSHVESNNYFKPILPSDIYILPFSVKNRFSIHGIRLSADVSYTFKMSSIVNCADFLKFNPFPALLLYVP